MNNDLISRSALLSEYCEGCDALAHKMCDQDICGVAMMINDAPAVDAVEVVRCKDCRYYGDEYFCPLRSLADYTDPNDFCCMGERKGDDD